MSNLPISSSNSGNHASVQVRIVPVSVPDAPIASSFAWVVARGIFNPSTDTLEIDTDSFGIDGSATFSSGKNKKEVKKVLAKQDFDFLYDQKKGGLYFNKNGSDKGFGDGGIIAILKGAPDLTLSNFEFI